MFLMDKWIPNLDVNKNEAEGIKMSFKKTTMLLFAVTIHNIPEGMAVGVVFAGVIVGNSNVTLAGAFALAIGIAVQNIPEGAIISLPLRSEGMARGKAFVCGILSGIVEPIAALITIALMSLVVPILPYLLSFAAGAMIYVVVEQLLPEACEERCSDIGIWGFAIGFMIMMVMDVALK